MITHILCWKGILPDSINMHVTYSKLKILSDNTAITLTFYAEDLVSIVFIFRSEPFGGVNEFLNFRRGKFSAKIYDLRTFQV